MELTIDEITALVLEHGRLAMLYRKTAAEHDRLAQVYLEAGKRFNRENEEKESKMKLRKILSGVLPLILLLVLMGSLFVTRADDATPEATEAVSVVATVNGNAVEATLEPVDKTAGQKSDVISLTWTALAGLISIVLTVGIAGGAGGAVAIIRAVRQNDTIKYAMEKLYLSASPETQQIIRGVVVVAKEGAELADELTDGSLPDAAKA